MCILTLCIPVLLANFSLCCMDLVHSFLSLPPTRHVPLKQKVLAIVLPIFQSRGVLVTSSKTFHLLMHTPDAFIVWPRPGSSGLICLPVVQPYMLARIRVQTQDLYWHPQNRKAFPSCQQSQAGQIWPSSFVLDVTECSCQASTGWSFPSLGWALKAKLFFRLWAHSRSWMDRLRVHIDTWVILCILVWCWVRLQCAHLLFLWCLCDCGTRRGHSSTLGIHPFPHFHRILSVRLWELVVFGKMVLHLLFAWKPLMLSARGWRVVVTVLWLELECLCGTSERNISSKYSALSNWSSSSLHLCFACLSIFLTVLPSTWMLRSN